MKSCQANGRNDSRCLDSFIAGCIKVAHIFHWRKKTSDKTVFQYFSFRVGIFDWCGTSVGIKIMNQINLDKASFAQ